MAHGLDFIGFTYNGQHSSSLKLLRVFSGNREQLSLSPTLEEVTSNVPGGDGQYYFGTYYRGQVFNLNLAYDSLEEADVEKIRALFNAKKISSLIFDEVPYKVYSVKPTGNANLSFIPFASGSSNRLYKGEGSIQLTAFSPYARSRFKWLEDYKQANIPEWADDTGNKGEWATASGIISKTHAVNKEYDVYDVNNSSFMIYNAGIAPTDFILNIPFDNNTIGALDVYIDQSSFSLKTNQITKIESDTKISINTKLNLIEGLDSNDRRTGNLYNDFIREGDFFKIPLKENRLVVSGATGIPILKYDFLYL